MFEPSSDTASVSLQPAATLIERLTESGPPEIVLHPTLVSTIASDEALPETFSLMANYPNPFNSRTVIRFALPTRADVHLALYNLAGQKVATLVSGPRPAGTYTVHWDGRDASGRDLASGVYLYRLRAGEHQVETRRLLLLR